MKSNYKAMGLKLKKYNNNNNNNIYKTIKIRCIA